MRVSWLVSFMGLVLFARAAVAANEGITVPNVPENEKVCADQCAGLLDGKTYKPRGLSGGLWIADDDAQCSAVMKDPCVNQPNDPRCYEGINYKISRCKAHTSQLDAQCAAFYASVTASGMEKLTVALDATAAATCTTACIAPMSGMATGCMLTGYMASAMEVARALVIQSKTEKLVGLVAGGGTAAALLTVARPIGALKAADGTAYAEKGGEFYKIESVGTQGSDRGVVKLSDTPATGNMKADLKTRNDTLKKKEKTNSCVGAAMYGALTGIRAASMMSHGGTRKQSCGEIKKLLPPALGTQTSAAPNPSSAEDLFFALFGGIALADSKTPRASVPFHVSCLSDSKCLSDVLNDSGSKQTAFDLMLLKKSGLGMALRQRAAALPMDQFETHLANGGGADFIIKAALGGSGGNLGSMVAEIARTAQRNSGSVGSLGANVTELASSDTEAAPAREPSYSLMNKPNENSGPRQSNLLPACDLGDIWHGCKGGPSIFEIISNRINQSRERVETLGYSTDANRKMAGQKK